MATAVHAAATKSKRNCSMYWQTPLMPRQPTTQAGPLNGLPSAVLARQCMSCIQVDPRQTSAFPCRGTSSAVTVTSQCSLPQTPYMCPETAISINNQSMFRVPHLCRDSIRGTPGLFMLFMRFSMRGSALLVKLPSLPVRTILFSLSLVRFLTVPT